MRATILLLLGLLGTTLPVCADEQFPVLKVGGAEVYSNVTVTSVSVTDIYFTHANGIGNAKIKDLDPVLQQHFHFDPAKAKAAALNSSSAGNPPDLSNPKAALDDAMARVRFIVNRPVTQLPITGDMQVAMYPTGWFHPGAIRPDFNTVDIRATQDTHYTNNYYVTSDLNPGVCFLGNELEFNAMTKFFYTDRTLPKKKLTEAEMLEINRLYRIIGTCEQKLAEAKTAGATANPGQPQDAASAINMTLGFLSVHKAAIVSVMAGLVFVLMFILNVRKGRREA
jgi:hypothetical protein